jgi:hypothetical protein
LVGIADGQHQTRCGIVFDHTRSYEQLTDAFAYAVACAVFDFERGVFELFLNRMEVGAT